MKNCLSHCQSYRKEKKYEQLPLPEMHARKLYVPNLCHPFVHNEVESHIPDICKITGLH